MSKSRRGDRRRAQARSKPSKAAATPAGGNRPTAGASRSRTERLAQSSQRPAPRQTSFWRGPGPLVGSLGAVVVLVVAFVIAGRSGLFGGSTGPAKTNPTADPAVVAQLAVSRSVIDAVGMGGQAVPLSKISGSALTSNGKPQMLYVGAEWCPYCAAERWAMAVALTQFGTLSNLHFTTSSNASGEVFPNTRTLSFFHSTYSSPYLDFVPVELEDRNHNPLESMNAQQQQLAQTYDSNSSIPFIDFGNQYTMIGQGVPPDPLQNLNWQQIGSALSNPNSPVTKAIVGNANYLTAAICKLPGTGGASICSDPVIQQIEGQLPK